MHALNHEDFFTKSTNARVMNGNRARPSQEPHLRQRVASGYPYENKTNEGKCSGKRSKAVFMVDARQHDDMRYRRGRRGEFLVERESNKTRLFLCDSRRQRNREELLEIDEAFANISRKFPHNSYI
ncbi:hypothetical protein Y032_0011g1436 [Ancylostoma ceylanicum]|uniref:Uncharacterized protein n=1 Tax=Ancylostoma ceylanicum TaxID=53326 RepID=A0A016VGJ0_9BILA|nr:hypothetical protein Y032_0011g1436 [Ancylostoma ceylanicum]